MAGRHQTFAQMLASANADMQRVHGDANRASPANVLASVLGGPPPLQRINAIRNPLTLNSLVGAGGVIGGGGAALSHIPMDDFLNMIGGVRSQVQHQQQSVRSNGPVGNAAVIQNPSGFLQRYRNSTTLQCYKPAPAPVREGAYKVFQVRQVNDIGLESFKRVSLHVGEEAPIEAPPSIYRDVPVALPERVLRSMPRIDCIAAMETETCPMCFINFESGERLLVTPCMHRVHDECANPWFAQSKRCPVCNNDCCPPANVSAHH